MPAMGGTYKPTWTQILFSFKGRIRRSHFWAAVGIQFLAVIVFLLPLAFMTDGEEGDMSPLFIIVLLVVLFFVYWISLATQAKRWHDRNKSAWWILINLVPYLGGLWALIECGILGPVEPNNYGPAAE